MSLDLNSDNILFYVNFVKGNDFKCIMDMMANLLPTIILEVSDQGIKICVSDVTDNTRPATILFNICLKRDDLKDSVCKSKRILSISSSNLSGVLKSVKKKDSISIYYLKKKHLNDPPKLYIDITATKSAQNDPKSNVSSLVVEDITNNPVLCSLPDDCYHYPKTIDADTLNRLKKNLQYDKRVKVSIQANKYICFECDNGINGGSIGIGRKEENTKNIAVRNPKTDVDYEKVPKDISYEYYGVFENRMFNVITKLSNLCNQSNIYAPQCEGAPLKIRTHVGTLGIMEIYIMDESSREDSEPVVPPKGYKKKNKQTL